MAARRRTNRFVRSRRHSSKIQECRGNLAVSDQGGQPEKPLIKIEIGRKVGCIPVNTDAVVVNLDNIDRHDFGFLLLASSGRQAELGQTGV